MNKYTYKIDFKKVNEQEFLEEFKKVFGRNYQAELKEAYEIVKLYNNWGTLIKPYLKIELLKEEQQ